MAEALVQPTGWYVLLDAALPEGAAQALKAMGIKTQRLTLLEPVHGPGLSFFTTDDIQAVLTNLGIVNVDVTLKLTNYDGVLLVQMAQKRRRVGMATRPEPREGADAFVEAYTDAVKIARHDLGETIVEETARIDALGRDLMAAERTLIAGEIENITLTAVDAAIRDALKAEYGKIGADARVERLQVTSERLIVTTSDVVLEQGNKRFRIGRLLLSLGLLDGSVMVQPVGTKSGPTAHPMVSGTGLLQLGALRDALVRFIGRREFAQAVTILLDLLFAAPRGGAAVVPLERWPAMPAPPQAQATAPAPNSSSGY